MEGLFVQRKPAYQFLGDFYRIRGIKDNNLEAKRHALKGLVHIPNYPVGKEPTLLELKKQLLHDNEYMV